MSKNKLKDFWGYIILLGPLILFFFIKWYWVLLTYNIIFLWFSITLWKENENKNVGLVQVILFPLLFNIIGLFYVLLKMDSGTESKKAEEIQRIKSDDSESIYINDKGELIIFREFLMVYSQETELENLPIEMQKAKSDLNYLENVATPYTGDDLEKNINVYKTIGEHIVFKYNLQNEISNLVDVKNSKTITDVVEMDWPSNVNIPTISVSFEVTFKILSKMEVIESLIKTIDLNMSINWNDNFTLINEWSHPEDFND